MLNTAIRAALLCAIRALIPAVLQAQDAVPANEIPIERCDRLPVVRARIGNAEVRFLLDTGATTVLNLKSFYVAPAGRRGSVIPLLSQC